MADGWYDEPDSGEESEGSIPLPAFAKDPIGVLRRRWLWMLLCLVMGLGATSAVVMLRQPTYVAETTILVSSQAIPEEFVRTTVVEDSLARINAIVGQVLSRQNLAGLVEQYDLYPDQREEASLAGIIAGMRAAIEILPQRSLSQTRRRDASSRVFVISFEYPRAKLAADVANELAALFTAANIEMRNRQAQLTTDFLRRELTRSERELRDHEHRITEFMQEHRGGLPGELEANIAKLERLQAQRQSLAEQIDAAEGRLVALSQQTDPILEIGPTPRSLVGDLRARLEEQRVILTEEHPNVIALRRRIERLEADIEEEEEVQRSTGPTRRQLAIAAEQRQLVSLRTQQIAVEAESLRLDAQVDETPIRQEEFSALEQRATVLRESYLGFLRKVQEAELAQSLESAQHGARISVLDRASPPSGQKHARWILLGGGMAASILFALGIGILLEIVDAVVVDPGHLESLSGKPILGSVPRVA